MVKIKLRRVKKGGRCLCADCDKKDCDELFVLAVESEGKYALNVHTIEALCRECALKFLDSTRGQCSSLGKQIYSGDYTVENIDVYERSIFDEEKLIQDAVAAALEPEWNLPEFEEDSEESEEDFDEELEEIINAPEFVAPDMVAAHLAQIICVPETSDSENSEDVAVNDDDYVPDDEDFGDFEDTAPDFGDFEDAIPEPGFDADEHDYGDVGFEPGFDIDE